MPTYIKWPAPVSGVRLEYAPEVLERLRLLAIDGLLALPKVGMAVGGFLIGSVDQGRVRVSDSLEIPCSHAVGPAFILTGAELARACALAFGDHKQQVVGWYCSRPRGELRLDPQQMALFGQICPEHWQVGLMLQPSTVQPTRALICVRSSDIEYAYGRAMDLVEYVPPVVQVPPEEVVPEILASARAEAPAPRRIEREPEVIIHEPSLPLPPPEPEYEDARPKRLYVLAALAGLVLVILLYVFRWDILDRPELILTVTEEGSQVMVRWNPDALAGIDEGSLVINDGGQLQTINLNQSTLTSGWIRSPHKSERVTVKLTAGEVSGVGAWTAPLLPAPQPTPPVR